MIKCIRYKPYSQGSLIGFADIFVSNWGLEIYGISYHEKDGKRWVNFPSKEYEKDGEKKHANFMRFPDSRQYTLFCDKVKESIENKIKETVGGDDNEFDSSLCF